MQETWSPVKGYVGYYEVSTLGRVRRLPKLLTNYLGVKRFYKGRILKLIRNPNGYLKVELSRNGKRKQLLVHRLVATAFLRNPQKKRTVNHRDSNRSNNYLDNLEWATHSENALHGYIYGHRVDPWSSGARIRK